MDWEAKPPAQFLCKELHFFCLNAFQPTHSQGIAHNNLGDLIFINDPFQQPKVVTLVLASHRL